MPKLPEVETVVRDLVASGLSGRTILNAHVYWPRTIGTVSPLLFRSCLKNRRIVSLHRRAKFIVMELSGGQWLLIHFRMTGHLFFADADCPRGKHEHVVFDLDDGRTLRFHDTRKFGRVILTCDPGSALSRLGPEPLDPAFSSQHFVKRMSKYTRMLKPLLLDQSTIAGLGNIYVDEALFDCKLHPQRSSSTLNDDELRALYRSIRKVLRSGIRSMGTTLGGGEGNFYSVAGRRGRNQDRLKVFRRQGEPCPNCSTTIKRIIVGQRSTHLCGRCQPMVNG